jgi:4'-phosphopantetheinyl transferase
VSTATAACARPENKAGFVESWRKVIRLGPGEAEGMPRIALWLAPIRMLSGAQSAEHILDADDILLLNQITPPASRDAARAGRVLLRTALSQAVGGRIRPPEWRICSSSFGKPVIGQGLPQIHFSISHTDMIVAAAVSDQLPIGIDVEAIEAAPTPELIATICCPYEQTLFVEASAGQSAREFIRLWTLKEAYVKMTGSGHAVDFAALGFCLESLRLLSEGASAAQRVDTHFETIWVSSGRTFNHVSIAIGFATSSVGAVDLQILGMTNRDDAAVLSPHIGL